MISQLLQEVAQVILCSLFNNQEAVSIKIKLELIHALLNEQIYPDHKKINCPSNKR